MKRELLRELKKYGYTEEKISKMSVVDIIEVLEKNRSKLLEKIKKGGKEMKRVRAYTVETASLYFWMENLHDREQEEKVGKILLKDAITEKEAQEILGYKLMRLFESSGILRPFTIVVLGNGDVEIHKAVPEEREAV